MEGERMNRITARLRVSVAILGSLVMALSASGAQATGVLGINLASGEATPADRVTAATNQVSDELAAYLASGTPGNLQRIDQAEVALHRALNALAAADPTSTVPRQVDRDLWVRSQLLFSFQTAWNAGQKERARERLIEALRLTDRISEATGSRLLSVDPQDLSANRARQIATTYGFFLPQDATGFDQAAPTAPAGN